MVVWKAIGRHRTLRAELALLNFKLSCTSNDISKSGCRVLKGLSASGCFVERTKISRKNRPLPESKTHGACAFTKFDTCLGESMHRMDKEED